MDAVVTAGGAPRPGEPLYEHTQGGYKAMLDIQGKPMVQWVLDALGASQMIRRVVVVGLPVFTDLACSKSMTILPDQGDMLANLKAGVDELVREDPSTQQFLAVASDIPAITPEMVDWMAKTVLETDDDIYYTVISRAVMEKRFPGSRRSYTQLKEVEICGGDLNAVRAPIVKPENPLYHRLIEARKSSIKQAALLGYDTLLLLLLRRLSVEEAAAQVSKRLGVKGRAVVCPYAEIGMDVDKPRQLEILRADLARLNVP